MAESIKVLIVDDSALMRKLVSRFFDDVSDIEVVGTAMNGHFALKKIETLHPDIIILDLEMPQMNGIVFLEERKKREIPIPVIILSSLAQKGARITMRALSLGASDFVLKPAPDETEGIRATREQLIHLIQFYGINRSGKTLATPGQPVPDLEKPQIPESIQVVGIGVSTGGPHALRHLLPRLRGTLPAPVLIVQHMPSGFTGEFASSLDKVCALAIKEAEEGDLIVPGRVLIAPGNLHLTIESKPLAKTIRLTDDLPRNGHRPSAGILFEQIAQHYGQHSLGVIMTGMGKDGALEIGQIVRAGGITLAQDESSSVVFGMPRVAIEKGNIHQVLPLNRMAETINRLVSG